MDGVKERAEAKKVEYLQSVQAEKEEGGRLKRVRAERDAALKAQAHVQKVAQTVQQQVHRQVASVVTRCLAAVFDKPYAFEIEFARKRGRTEAALWLVRDGKKYDPKDGVGGGVRDVAALGLRLAKLLLELPRRRRLLVLDEPFRNLSKKYRPKMVALLNSLSRELGVQFVIVTHESEYVIGKVVELS